jgi:hypothetical protein
VLIGVVLISTTACAAANESPAQQGGQPVAAANPALAIPASTPSALPSGLPRSLDCDMTISASYVRLDSVATLSWVSHQVVAGTIVEEFPPIWVYPDPQRRPHGRKVYTDYLVRVEQRLRGLPEPTVRVRRLGGTLDGCTQQNPDEPPLVVGERRLLFLHEFTVPNSSVSAYSAIGGPQGHWGLNADGTVTTPMPQYQAYDRVPLTRLAGEIQPALLGTPPTTVPQNLIVPLDQAPLAAMP